MVSATIAQQVPQHDVAPRIKRTSGGQFAPAEMRNGEKRCGGCKLFRPISDYRLNGKKNNKGERGVRSLCRPCEAAAYRVLRDRRRGKCSEADCMNIVAVAGRRCQSCATTAQHARRREVLAERGGRDIHGRRTKPHLGAKGDIEKCRENAVRRRDISPERYMEIAPDAIWHLPYKCLACKERGVEKYVLMAGLCYTCATSKPRTVLREEERNSATVVAQHVAVAV